MKKRKEQKELSSVITRRLLLIGGGQFLLGAGLVARLYQLQIAQSENYQQLSDRNQFDQRFVLAPRGRLFDQDGRLLAGNSEVFELNLLPARIENIDSWLENVSKLIDLSPDDKTRIKEDIEAQPDFLEVTVKSGLTQRELARLAILSPVLEGASFHKSFRRIYPQGWMTAHITGYVSPVNKRDIERNPNLRYLPGSRIGRSGIEQTLNPDLAGALGVERIEVNARGKPVRVLEDKPAEPGDDVELTIDIELQAFATERLRRGKSETVPLQNSEVQQALLKNDELRAHVTTGDTLVLRDERGRLVPAESGAVTVMDIQTGEIKAMISVPSYDPNLFSGRLSVRDWRRLNEHPRTPLMNRVTSGLYAPGSTFKMVVVAAAIEAGVITPRTEVKCEGSFEFGNRLFHCWNEKGHGFVNAASSLERSCDIYYYQIALKTGINRINNMARRMGLGEVTEIGIPSERKGIIPDRDWKLENRGAPWTPGETVVAGIGQGFVLTTPLQLAVMTARIANGNKAVRPVLYKGQAEPADFEPLQVSPEILKIMRNGMVQVMTGPLGTARKYDLQRYGGIAGKTGTVQVKRITKEQREEGITENIDRPWKERDHALFVAYAPVEKPRYAISVVVEHGGSGSSMAAPIARDIFEYIFATEKGRQV